MKAQQKPARERILQAASQLFYLEGIRAVSVDAIADKAGVTKKTLYYHFRSKDDLVEGYLTSRDQPTLAVYQRWFGAGGNTLESRICALFDGAREATAHPKWRGCGFMRTVGELANMPGHPAVKAGAKHKLGVEEWLAGEFAAAGLREPERLACRAVIAIDGAFASMMIHHDPRFIDEARELVLMMIAAAR